jgi:uncharacterized protein (DUF169 family)
MLLGEAARAAGRSAKLEALPRPTCMAIPAAAAHGATMSLGCIGNRVYTELGDESLYTMLRGGDVEAIVAALATIQAANQTLTSYHNERKQQLTRGE